jgi:hypothetical protein
MGKEFITDNGYIIQTPASLSEGLKAGDDDAPLKVDSHGTNTASKAVGKKFGVAKKVRDIRSTLLQNAHGFSRISYPSSWLPNA